MLHFLKGPASAVLMLMGLVTLSTISTSEAAEMQVSRGLLCDTAEQVERIMLAPDREAERQVVNAETGIASCIVGTIAWTPVGVVATFETTEGPTDVMEVIMYGISYDGQTMNPLPPVKQYLPFLASVKPAGLRV